MNMALFNVNVLIQDEDTPMWSLYFYKPYRRHCHSVDVIKIETFTPENYTKELKVPFTSLFPSRHLKFNYCPLLVSTLSIPPFVFIPKANGSTTFTGLDVTIVNEIAKTLHLLPIYMLAPDKKNRGSIFQNGTATGAVKMVIDGDANMTIGTYALSPERINLMSHTKPYFQNLFIFAFRESDQLATPLARLMSPFQSSIWVAVAFLLSISILVILLTKRLPLRHRHFIIGGRMNRTPILNMMNSLIGNSISNPRMADGRSFCVFGRSLFALWLFFWLVVRNSYQGSLYQSLQSQRVKSPFDTVEKVRKSNVNIYITSTAVNLIPKEFSRQRYILFLQLFFSL